MKYTNNIKFKSLILFFDQESIYGKDEDAFWMHVILIYFNFDRLDFHIHLGMGYIYLEIELTFLIVETKDSDWYEAVVFIFMTLELTQAKITIQEQKHLVDWEWSILFSNWLRIRLDENRKSLWLET